MSAVQFPSYTAGARNRGAFQPSQPAEPLEPLDSVDSVDTSLCVLEVPAVEPGQKMVLVTQHAQKS